MWLEEIVPRTQILRKRPKDVFLPSRPLAVTRVLASRPMALTCVSASSPLDVTRVLRFLVATRRSRGDSERASVLGCWRVSYLPRARVSHVSTASRRWCRSTECRVEACGRGGLHAILVMSVWGFWEPSGFRFRRARCLSLGFALRAVRRRMVWARMFRARGLSWGLI